MAQLTLLFSDTPVPALDAIQFIHVGLDAPRTCRRGKGIYGTITPYTFQWSRAVRAMAVLILYTKSKYVLRSEFAEAGLATLSGEAGSMAASLDYALSKRPLWLLDMFGASSSGEPLVRNLFMRWNSERKRGGSVVVALNPRQLESKDIEVRIGGIVIDSPESCMELAAMIERGLDPQIQQGLQSYPTALGISEHDIPTIDL